MMVVTHDMKFSKEIANRVFYMDEGTIYEDGTPEQIFENPQREKTRAFVKRLRTLEYSIKTVDFDIYELNSKINEFGRNNFLTAKQINNLQLIIEEVVINNILKKTQNIQIQISYFEVDDKLVVTFEYGGEKFNPYESDDEDILSMLLVRQLTNDVQYSFNNTNILNISLK
jgi:polar amino acid transport system ATP-binding protein